MSSFGCVPLILVGKGYHMGDLYFKVASNYQEVTRLRTEVAGLENALRKFGPVTDSNAHKFEALQFQLTKTRTKLRTLTSEAAQAGADLEGGIRRGVDGAINALEGLQSKLRDPIGGTLAIAGIGALGGFLNQIKNVRSEFQQMETSINVLLQSERRGTALMQQLNEFAKISPLDFKGTVGAAQQMIGFGISDKDVTKYIKAISDISMGDAGRFQSLTLAFSQMSAAGKLMGQDLMQMVNAGFQPLQIMAEKTGKSIGQLKEEMSSGKITAKMVQDAFVDAASEGGRYYQMSEKASATINGQMSMLEDSFDLLFNDLGSKSEGAIITVIKGANAIVENYEKLLPVIGSAIAAFGVYKASAMAAAFADRKGAEQRSEAIKEGFEEELKKMEEIKVKRAELAMMENSADNTTPATPDDAIKKGSRYNSDISEGLVKRIMPDLGNSDSMRADIEDQKRKTVSIPKDVADLENALDQNDAKLDQLDERITKAQKRRDELEKRFQDSSNILSQNTDQHGVAPQSMRDRVDKDKDRLDEAEKRLAELKKARRETASKGADLADAKNRLELEKATLRSAEAIAKEEEAMRSLQDAEKGLLASEGSLTQKKARLSLFEETYEGMSPDEMESDFGVALREQIEGLKADLQGVANLDSDLADALSVGDISEELAHKIQEQRNELDDLIDAKTKDVKASEDAASAAESLLTTREQEVESIRERIEALHEAGEEDEADAEASNLAIAQTEAENAATEANTLRTEANTRATQLSELQNQRAALAEARNTAALNANTVSQNTNAAANRRGAIASALFATKQRIGTVVTHLATAANNALKNSLDAIKVAWATNPLGLIATGLMTLWSIYQGFKAATADDDAAEMKKFADETARTKSEIELLYATIDVADRKSKVYKDSIDELKKACQDYGIEIKDEADMHDVLVSKKEKLIALIKEEGKQRMIAASIEKLQSQNDKAREKMSDYFAEQIDSPNAKAYADMIVADLDMDALGELISKYYQTFEDGNAYTRQEYVKNIDAMIDKASEGAREMARNLDGAAIDVSQFHQHWYNILGIGTDFISDFHEPAKLISNNEKMLSQYNEKLRETNRNMEDAKETAKVLYSDMDAKKLAEGMKDAAQAAKKLSSEKFDVKVSGTKELDEVAKKFDELEKKRTKQSGNQEPVKISVDATEVDALNSKYEGVSGQQKKVDETVVAPKADTTEVKGVKDSATEAGDKLQEASDKKVSPTSDTTSIDAATDAAQQTKDKLDVVDQTVATPTINTSSIANALSQLQMIQLTLNSINGTSKGYLSSADYNRLRQIESEMTIKTDKNGRKWHHGTKEQVAEYEKLTRRAADSGTFNFGNGEVALENDADRAFMYSIRNNPQYLYANGTINKNALPADVRTVYDQTAGKYWNKRQKQNIKENEKAFDDMESEYRKRGKDAKTENELNSLSSEIGTILKDIDKTSSEYKRLKKLKDEIDKKNGKGGKSSKTGRSKEEKAEDEWRNREAERKAYESVSEAMRKRDAQLKKEEVDAMAEGNKKRIAQIRLDAENERIALEDEAKKTARQMREQDRSLWVQAGGKTKKDKRYNYQWDATNKDGIDPQTYTEYLATVKPGEEAKSEEDYYASLGHEAKSLAWYEKVARERAGISERIVYAQSKERKELKEVYDKQKEDLIDYLRNHGTAQEKRLATVEYYNRRIKEAAEQGDMAGQMSAMNEKYETLMRMDSEKIFRDINWDTVFADFTYCTDEALANLKKQLEEILGDAKLNLTIENKERLANKINEITRESSRRNNAFSSSINNWFDPRRQERQERQERWQEAKDKRDRARDDLKQKQTEQTADQLRLRSYVKDSLGKDLNVEIKPENADKFMSAFQEKGLDTSKLGDMFGKLGQSQAGVEQAAQAFQGAEGAFASMGGEAGAAAGGGGGMSGAAVADAIIHGVNDNIQSMGQLMDELNIRNTKFGEGMESFMESSQYATAAFDSLKNGDFVGVVANALGALRTLGDALGKWGIGFMGSSDVDLAKDIERLTAVNQELVWAVGELSDDLREAKLSEYSELYDETAEDIKKSMDNSQEMMQRSGAAYSNGFLGIGGKHSSNKAIDDAMKGSDWDKVSEIVGHSVRSAREFFNLTSEEMADVRKRAPEIYQMIKDKADDGYADAAQFMDEYTELYKRLEELEMQRLEDLTKISFDSLVDNFSSALMDMDGDMSRFTESFQDMMKRMVIESLVKEKYEERIKGFQNKWADFSENSEKGENGEAITDREQKELQDEWDSIVKDATDDVKSINDTLGFDSLYSQSASAKTYQGMTQDQAGEISGRLTAIASTTEMIRQNSVFELNAFSEMDSRMYAALRGQDDVLVQVIGVADLVAEMSLDVAQIRDNTLAIVRPIKTMSTDVSEIKDKIRNI